MSAVSALVVVIPVGYEQEVGRRADVDAVEPDGQG